MLIKQISNLFYLLIICCLLTACSSQREMPAEQETPVMGKLNQQLRAWHGTPYHYGGMSRQGIDCSGFVYLTYRDLFGKVLPRSTIQQAKIGRSVHRDKLMPGDLLFFKTASAATDKRENGLHVGIYNGNNQFIHASTSKGVIQSNLSNNYWAKTYWQSRRL